MEEKQGETKTRIVRWHKTMTLAFITSITEIRKSRNFNENLWVIRGEPATRYDVCAVPMLTRPRNQGIDPGQAKRFLSLPICLDLTTTKLNGKKGLAKQTYPGIRRTERIERLISSPALTVAGKGRAQVLKGECKSKDGRG